LLINEIENDPPNQQSDSCQYVEIRGQNAGGVIPANTYFVSINSDNDNPGFVTQAVNIGGQTIGPNGTITLINTFNVPCPNRSYGATTIVNYLSPLPIGGANLTTGSENFTIVQSATTLFSGQDIDANDDGEIDFPVTFIDAVSYIINPEENFVYPANSPVVNAATPFTDVPDALVRGTNKNAPFDVTAFYFGELAASPDESITFVAPLSSNFPAGGQLTPGAPNVGTLP
jgi:hypothetical protein